MNTKTPRPPKDLPDLARAEWLKLSRLLTNAGGLTELDLRAFRLLCEILATAEESRAIIEKDGMLISTGAGGFKAHPAIKVMEASRNQAARLLEQFGLTPKGRKIIKMVPGKKGLNRFDKRGVPLVKRGKPNAFASLIDNDG